MPVFRPGRLDSKTGRTNLIAVAEELSFSRGAERLNVSQPPLSRQIRDLESELKVKLFERNRQEVKLTTVGRTLLIRARELMRDAELLRTYTETMRAETCEHLHLGYAPAPTAAVIASILGRYHEQAPGASVSVIAAVEAGHAPAVVGEFTTAVAGDRVHYIPFVSKASFMHVGLLYRKSETGENVKKLIASCLDVRQAFK